MKAYHIKTSEEDGLFEYFDLHSIYIPETSNFNGAIVGFVAWKDKQGLVRVYNYEDYKKRVECIINKTKDYGEEVRGEVISEIDIPNKTVEAIASNYDNNQIKITKEFDKSTECLVGILSGPYRQRNFLEKILGL